MRAILPATLFLTLLSAGSVMARADQLLVNGGFETGTLEGFTTVPAADGSFFGVSTGHQHSGDFAAFFAGTKPNSFDTISQTLPTVAGATYGVSFWLESNLNNHDFQALWNGVVVYENSDKGTGSYVQVNLTEVAVGKDVLSFRDYNVPSFDYLDDVSVSTASSVPVTPTPEPSTLVLLGTGLLSVAGAVRRRLDM